MNDLEDYTTDFVKGQKKYKVHLYVVQQNLNVMIQIILVLGKEKVCHSNCVIRKLECLCISQRLDKTINDKESHHRTIKMQRKRITVFIKNIPNHTASIFGAYGNSS